MKIEITSDLILHLCFPTNLNNRLDNKVKVNDVDIKVGL